MRRQALCLIARLPLPACETAPEDRAAQRPLGAPASASASKRSKPG